MIFVVVITLIQIRFLESGSFSKISNIFLESLTKSVQTLFLSISKNSYLYGNNFCNLDCCYKKNTTILLENLPFRGRTSSSIFLRRNITNWILFARYILIFIPEIFWKKIRQNDYKLCPKFQKLFTFLNQKKLNLRYFEILKFAQVSKIKWPVLFSSF